jgi:hypothetical protein
MSRGWSDQWISTVTGRRHGISQFPLVMFRIANLLWAGDLGYETAVEGVASKSLEPVVREDPP